MKTPVVVIEENMEIAYSRYVAIVQKGLNLLPPVQKGVGAEGGQFFILQDHFGEPKFSFMYAKDSQGRSLSYCEGTKVIAHERINGEATFNELYEYLPTALGMSAIHTAGLTHKFLPSAQ